MLRATVMVVNAGKRHRARVRASRRRSSECRVGYFRAISTANRLVLRTLDAEASVSGGRLRFPTSPHATQMMRGAEAGTLGDTLQAQ